MNRKTTKRSLMMSVLSLFLCFSMLLGTTFAWFTDSVSSANNIITAGNLDIEVYYAYPSDVVNGNIPDENWKVMNPADPVFDNDALWEPGYTQVVYFKILNVGSLAAKYQFKVDILNETPGTNVYDESFKLSDYIQTYMNACTNRNLFDDYCVYSERDIALNPPGAPKPFYTSLANAADGTLANDEGVNSLKLNHELTLKPADEYDNELYATFVLWMPTSVDNVANYKKGTTPPRIDLGISVLATQYTYENDSFGKDYDSDATYPVVSAPTLLPSDSDEVTSNVVINAGGMKVTVPAEAIKEIINDTETNVETVSVAYTAPRVEGNAVVFDSIELVDQNNQKIDLEALDLNKNVTVSIPLPADSNIANGTNVEIYHDGELVAYATVTDGKITYEVAHFCEVTIKTSNVNLTPVNGVVTIDSAAALLAFAADVNAGNSYKGITVQLTKDIDLDGVTWTPIGTSEKPFQGIFDGNGKVIKNLKVLMVGKSNVGLFGYTTDGEIKNVTVENAKVIGRLNVGVVAGTPYTSKYTNIKVTGHVEVDGMAYVGGVAGKNAYADWTNIVVDVDESSYVNANSVENGTAYRTYVGGVVGFNGEGGHTFKDITSNINVYGSTCDVGGAFGIAHYNNKFENVKVTGNVTITGASEAAEAEEIGGIAGVWHNESGTTVTFTDCVFSGTLNTNITEGVDLSDNTITGAKYGAGTGELIIVNYVTDNQKVTYAHHTGTNKKVVLYKVAEDAPAKIVIPNYVTHLRAKILDGNTTVKEVVIPSSVTDFGGTPNATGTGASGGMFYNSAVEKVTLPEGITEIPAATFNQAANLKEVNIPSSVKTIGINAFAGSGLETLEIPATVEEIGYGAFRDMDSLTTVTIEGDVNIPHFAFRDCSALKNVYLKGVNVTFTNGNMIFCVTSTNNENPNGITVHVRNNTVKARLEATGHFKGTIVVTDTVDENGVATDANGDRYIVVETIADLQNALDKATGTMTVILGKDMADNVTVTQKPGVAITIDGNGMTFSGVIVVNGGSARYEAAECKIENVIFEGKDSSIDAYIKLGLYGDNTTRYISNVTVTNCTFSGDGVVAVKSYTGGDWNVTLDHLTVNAGMHSLAQLKNVEQNLVVTYCEVYSKNGLNVNNGTNLTMDGCTFDVKGYAVRFGSDTGVYERNYTISNSTLKSACAESGDAVVEFRAGAIANSTLTLTKTTLTGDVVFKGNTADTKIVIDEYTAVVDGTSLTEALAAGKNVIFLNDITMAASKGGYSVAGIVVNKGQTVDGNGYTLTVTGANDTYGCVIYLTNGTIKNITVAGAMRGVFTAGQSADLYLDNVTFKNVVYTFNSDDGNKDYTIYISNCNMNGWTSHSNVHKAVVYTNCTFAKGSGYQRCRPYGATEFVNCTFEEGYEFDASQTSAITFEGCSYGDTLITAENAATLGYGENKLFYNGLNGITIK